MSLSWNPAALPGLLALVTGASMAAVVYWTRPGRRQNRRLALMLAVEGATFGALGGLFLATSPGTAAGMLGILIVMMLLQPWVYLAFLATLDSPLVDPLDNRVATAVFALAAALGVGSYLLRRDLFVERLIQGPMFGGFDWVGGPLANLAFMAILAVALFGLVVAVSVYRRTPDGSARRSTARAYLAAFGVRDTLHTASLAYIVAGGGASLLLHTTMATWLPQVASVLFSLLLAYGILTTQLFDIELKLKWTLEKSTVAGIFVAVFFIVSEGAQIVFADFVGSEILGVFAAGGLVFVLAPLQRFADRVADAAMPGVEDTPAYRGQRARELYRAAVESGLEDGIITHRERDMLARLQDELELTGQDALELEREVLGAGGGDAA